MDEIEKLLKEITEAHGVPGYETPVRSLVRDYFAPLGELSQDKIGSVICCKTGSAPAPRVMLAGHMDEIGFMVKHITKEGYIKFLPLGGWFDQTLLGQRVIIKTRLGDVIGVIGVKPPHLLSSEERAKVITRKEMYIDIGATSLDEVTAAGVRAGDPIVPHADFNIMASGKTYLSKAFDDRVGVAMIISVLQELQTKEHPNTIFGAATVMEEVGVRGATTAVEVVNPDVAIILESDIAGDVPGVNPEECANKLGQGPTVLIYDARMIPNLKLRDMVVDAAAELSIPIQLSAIEGGATDGSVIHLYKTGVPTVVIGVPARHIHSHSSIIHRSDYDNAVRLLVAILTRLDASKVAEFTA
ncbi:MAG TPA: M42 family metallopeptidase [Anaerolineaceae bacterium]|nr:M42 family metallopeptidase [Anaerolineaceae bacterium]HPN51050.1 M42 family metallopeptidase [Anaerolineaceae bacterium]